MKRPTSRRWQVLAPPRLDGLVDLRRRSAEEGRRCDDKRPKRSPTVRLLKLRTSMNLTMWLRHGKSLSVLIWVAGAYVLGLAGWEFVGGTRPKLVTTLQAGLFLCALVSIELLRRGRALRAIRWLSLVEILLVLALVVLLKLGVS